MIDEMHRSLVWWLRAALRRREPEIRRLLLASDDSPASEIQRVMRRLTRRWQRNFADAAPRLSEYFATTAADRSDRALASILRDGGYFVKFSATRAVNDVLRATIHENVSLIRSIAQQHLTQVEGAVMRSVQRGRDLEHLVEELGRIHQVSRRRAELIARDQNNKATSTIQRVRQVELGVTRAVWVHSGGGREPRPSHVRAGRDRVEYDVREGWFDPDEGRRIFPGELINCRCVSRPVIEGFA